VGWAMARKWRSWAGSSRLGEPREGIALVCAMTGRRALVKPGALSDTA